MNVISVFVPGTTASKSKAAKKGWKCWAKNLESVADLVKNGYDYHGAFVDTSAFVECREGDVLLHVDDADEACLGIVYKDFAGNGQIYWVAGVPASKWAASLAKQARELLAKSPEERLACVASYKLDCENLADATRAYYSRMLGVDDPEGKDGELVESAREVDDVWDELEAFYEDWPEIRAGLKFLREQATNDPRPDPRVGDAGIVD